MKADAGGMRAKSTRRKAGGQMGNANRDRRDLFRQIAQIRDLRRISNIQLSPRVGEAEIHSFLDGGMPNKTTGDA